MLWRRDAGAYGGGFAKKRDWRQSSAPPAVIQARPNGRFDVTSVATPSTTPSQRGAPTMQYRATGIVRGIGNPTTVVPVIFSIVVVVLLAGLGGRPASVAYAVVAVLAGGFLYANSPSGYISFTLWLWFITPFVRRVLDMHHGWNPTSPVLLAPLAVAALSGLGVLRRIGELRGSLYAPFLLVFLALGYGYSIGGIKTGMLPATYALTTWLAPALFGLHIAINWRRYPEFSDAVRKTFKWALPLLAAYGVYQFVRMPRWDAMWMINADMQSIGAPRPFLARVFGTLNAPGPFGAFMCTGALILLPTKGRLKFISIGVAMIALLLARTRAAWVAFVIGLLVQQIGQPLKKLPRYAITLIAVTIVALPIVNMPQFSALIMPRLLSFTKLSEDNSFIKRYNFTKQAASGIVETAEGNGLGTTGGASKLRGAGAATSFDNGVLEIFFIFGWPGGGLFYLGLAGLMLQAVRFRETRGDPFANAVRASSVALISMIPIGDVFTGATGTMLWMSFGFGIAGHAYHLTTGQALRSQAMRRANSPTMAPPTQALPPDAVGHPARA